MVFMSGLLYKIAYKIKISIRHGGPIKLFFVTAMV